MQRLLAGDKREGAAAKGVAAPLEHAKAVSREQVDGQGLGEIADVLLPENGGIAAREAGLDLGQLDDQETTLAQQPAQGCEEARELADMLGDMAQIEGVENAVLGHDALGERRREEIAIDHMPRLGRECRRSSVRLDPRHEAVAVPLEGLR